MDDFNELSSLDIKSQQFGSLQFNFANNSNIPLLNTNDSSFLKFENGVLKVYF
jgi:hypothetical protein